MKPENVLTTTVFLFVASLATFASCTLAPAAPTPPAAVVPVPAPVQAMPVLRWEAGHPERVAWTAALFKDIDSRFADFDSAKDASKFCKNYAKLTHFQKVKVFTVLMEWDAMFESSWNPGSESVDVGTPDDRNTWSVGLWQMSVTDQANYGIKLGYSYADLKDPIKNSHLAIPILADLIKKYGYIAQKPGGGSYWSSLRPNTSAPKIMSHTQAVDGCN